MNPRSAIEQAILNTVIYADIFQYPLTEEEIYRYLVRVKTTRQAVHEGLQVCLETTGSLIRSGPYYLLAGREQIVPLRLQRAQVATGMWHRAYEYGRLMAQLPFVRMIAVTGSLAMNNVDPGGDIDYLVVTQPGRLWLARGLVVLLVRFAALRGDRICPNYFLSERALYLPDQNLFSAHELIQMVPLFGVQTYARMCRVNPWVDEFLPNSTAAPSRSPLKGERRSWFQKVSEQMLSSHAGDRVEGWEMQRKLRKFQSMALGHAEAQFGPDFCKGHVDDHGGHTLQTYADRLQLIEGISI